MNDKARLNTLKSSLWSALKAGDNAAAHAALEAGADPNGGYGTWVPLGWTIRNGKADLALIMIEAGADINVIENGKSLFSLSIATDGFDDVVALMIARGIKPNGHILRAAAKKANAELVAWALDGGVDPNDLSRYRETTLRAWPARIPLPQRLLDAIFENSIPERAASQIADIIVRRKRIDLLDLFVKKAQVSEGIKQLLLKAAVVSKWRKGIDLILDAGYCAPDPTNSHLLTACATSFQSQATAKQGRALLGRLLDYGFDINGVHTISAPDSEEAFIGSDALGLLRQASDDSRADLLDFMIERGLSPVFSGRHNADTLVHALISVRAWDLLPTALQAFPGAQWEHPLATSLLAIWAKHHRPRDMSEEYFPEETLACVRAVPGMDMLKKNKEGQSGLRDFMKRPNGKRFTAITTILMDGGIDPFAPDLEGVSDLDYCRKMSLPSGAYEAFEAHALRLRTKSASSGGTVARRL